MTHVYHPQLDAFELYHLENTSSNHSSVSSPVLPALGHAVSGSTASALSHLLLYPLDLIVTRLRVERTSQSAISATAGEDQAPLNTLRRIYENEGGLKGFYRGLTPDVAKSFLDGFLFFLVYELLRRRRRGDLQRVLTALEELGIGIAAGAVAKLFTTPLGCVVTRLQIATPVVCQAARDDLAKEKDGIRTVIKMIKKEKGWKGFWSGYAASLFLTLNPSITFFVYRLFDKLLPGANGTTNGKQASRTFFMAAVSKAIASMIMYPAMLAKSRQQAGLSGSHPSNDGVTRVGTRPEKDLSAKEKNRDLLAVAMDYVSTNSIIACLAKIYKEEGPSVLYSGLQAEILKGFLGHGMTMMIKQEVHRFVLQLYFVLLKLSARYSSPEELVARVKSSALENASKVRDRTEYTASSIQAKVDTTTQRLKNSAVAVAPASIEAVETTGGRTAPISGKVRSAYDKMWNSASWAADATAGRTKAATREAQEFASREAGHLLGSAQDMIKPKLSREVD